MNNNIAKAKTLREKSKDVKDRLKLDIKELNDTIEDHIQKIGQYFILESIRPFQSTQVQGLTNQLQSAQIAREKLLDELGEKVTASKDQSEVYSHVQKVLDKKVEQLEIQRDNFDAQLKEYTENLNPSEHTQFLSLAKEYQKLIREKVDLENKLQQK